MMNEENVLIGEERDVTRVDDMEIGGGCGAAAAD